MLKSLLITGLLGFSNLVSAQDAAPKVVLSAPVPRGALNRGLCKNVFAPFSHRVMMWTDVPGVSHGELVPIKMNDIDQFPRVYDSAPGMIINRWAETRNYTTEKIAELRETQDARDPMRTTVMGFAHEGWFADPLNTNLTHLNFSGARIFDGSTRPLMNGLLSREVSPSTKELTFERDLRDQGFILPERAIEEITGRPAHIMEVGLLNIERNYRNGAQALLGLLAREVVDPNYNSGNYNLLRNLDILARNNLVLYVINRKANVRINERFGFDLVYDTRTQQPVRTSQGYFLMKMSAVKLMELYAEAPLRILQRGERPVDDGPHRTQVSDYFQMLHRDAPDLKLNGDYLLATYRLGRLHELLFEATPEQRAQHPEIIAMKERLPDNFDFEFSRYNIFFEAYYKLAHSYFSKMKGITPEQYARYMIPYRTMLNRFDNHPAMYELFLEGRAAGELILVPNSVDMNGFQRTQLEGWKAEATITFLEGWNFD